MSANRWLARAEEIRRARSLVDASTLPGADDVDIERAAIVAEGCQGASVQIVQIAHVQESPESTTDQPSGPISEHVQIGQIGQKAPSAEAEALPEHPWVIPEHMRRLDWPAGGWQELHATLLVLWSAPRRDTFGTISRHAPGVAARLAFSDLCDCWRRRYLPEEKDGTRARVEAAKALAAFGVTAPLGWEA
jgi:hypothetical protein